MSRVGRFPRQTAVVATAVAVLGLAMAACGSSEAEDGCAPLRWQAAGPATPATDILLDADDNSPQAADRAVAALRPHLDNAVTTGEAIRLVVDPGTGQPLITVDCLDGTRVINTDRENIRRARADLQSAQEKVAELVWSAVREAPVQPSGTPTRLLALAADIAGPDTTVVLWSSLLGVSAEPGDCLDAEGLIAEPAAVAAVVARCLESSQLAPIPAGRLVIAGHGAPSLTTEQARFAGLLAHEICRQIADECEVQ